MSDEPQQPESASPQAAAPNAQASVHQTYGQGLIKGTDFKEEVSPALHTWLKAFFKAMKGMRVYAENNEMFLKFTDRAYANLVEVFKQLEEFTLSVREDRLLYKQDPVLIDSDRAEGLPFVLYRNAFRRITIVRGMEKDEMISLIKALITDYSGFDYAGEDLVTTLWRLALPHLRYLTIDALTTGSAAQKGGLQQADEDIDRIQADIEGIVAAIYKNSAPADDIVAGVSITKEDLEALKDIREESEEDLDILDHATARAIADIPHGQIVNLQTSLLEDTRDNLTSRMIDVLIQILFKEESAQESKETIELLQQLFDSMLLGQRYGDASALVHRLTNSSENATKMQEIHISRHLLRLFAAESRVVPVLSALNDNYRTGLVSEMIEFLRALGPSIAPYLLGGLDNLESAAHRRLICDLIVEFGVPDVPILIEKSNGVRWFVVRDVLSLAQHHPLDRIAVLVNSALEHEHPKVREAGVRLLRGYRRGLPDRLLAGMLKDVDIDVRVAAIRVAVSRKSIESIPVLEELLQGEELVDREAREIRVLLNGYAQLASSQAVPLLAQLLNVSFFSRLKNVDLQVSAAFALGTISSEAAISALQKGTRTINSKVREACKRALRREVRKEEKLEEEEPEILPAVEEVKAITGIPGAAESSVLEAQTPLVSNAADVDFTANIEMGDEHLSHGPDFLLDPQPMTSGGGTLAPAHPALRSGPALPQVQKPHSATESIPDNLIPAPMGAPEKPAAVEAAHHDILPGQSISFQMPEAPAAAKPISGGYIPIESEPPPPQNASETIPLETLDSLSVAADEINILAPEGEVEEAFQITGNFHEPVPSAPSEAMLPAEPPPPVTAAEIPREPLSRSASDAIRAQLSEAVLEVEAMIASDSDSATSNPPSVPPVPAPAPIYSTNAQFSVPGADSSGPPPSMMYTVSATPSPAQGTAIPTTGNYGAAFVQPPEFVPEESSSEAGAMGAWPDLTPGQLSPQQPNLLPEDQAPGHHDDLVADLMLEADAPKDESE